MAHTILDSTIHEVPFLGALGVTVESASPGEVILRLPYHESFTDHSGSMHSACLFALGELAATLGLGVHPGLAGHSQRQKCTKIKYFSPCQTDALARIVISDALVSHVTSQQDSQVEVLVQVIDEHHTPVAEVLGLFAFSPADTAAPV